MGLLRSNVTVFPSGRVCSEFSGFRLVAQARTDPFQKAGQSCFRSVSVQAPCRLQGSYLQTAPASCDCSGLGLPGAGVRETQDHELWNSRPSASAMSRLWGVRVWARAAGVPLGPARGCTLSQQQIEAEKRPTSALDEPVSHWRPRLTLNVMVDNFVFDGASLPADVQRYMKMIQLGKTVQYLPILFIDQLSNRVKDLMVINRSSTELPLTVSYDKISLGRLRFWIHMQDAVYSLQQFGFSEKDADEVKGIFVDTNLYFLALTFFVAAFHLLFDFLAFKNDISFWKKKKSMIGMSTKAVLWRCFSTVVIFLFLLDEQTSLLVLVPAGIGAAIELWKVKKALKMTVIWRGLWPTFQFGTYSESERRTEEYDAQAMKYLSYLLYPLCIGGAIYSLLNIKYKSWYSWLINSFVNGVYAFGFLFMLPQLFVNYKMKSVAHLPWKAFTYKAFNTFIDDVFAFIITMPTSHRLACFRDDVVFLVYLYQRWLYPVDKSRVNEFGESYEDTPQRKPHTD
ncbi:lipid scramblase CLPTM1L isoform X3 [Bos javanicus]|uniref:lipid scramblase CLPTM1L isoform X3 n=1 Tax=Bos javanicus TaxID=9906 RepID=UPI002AA89799|nr:lipid scramblase CLPTM1L isoform X3 [Bos javanicus]